MKKPYAIDLVGKVYMNKWNKSETKKPNYIKEKYQGSLGTW